MPGEDTAGSPGLVSSSRRGKASAEGLGETGGCGVRFSELLFATLDIPCMYPTGMTTGNPPIHPPSYVLNEESEAQQMNNLPNLLQPLVEVEP